MTEDELVAEHLPAVKRLARNYHRRVPLHVEYDDLLQEALVGFLSASRTWDPDRGVPLMAYARGRIIGAMTDHMRQLDHLTRAQRQKVKAMGVEDMLDGMKYAISLENVDHFDVLIGLSDPRFDEVEWADLLRHVLVSCTTDERHREMVRARLRGVSLKKIGDDAGVSESRASQVFTNFVEKAFEYGEMCRLEEAAWSR